MLAVGIGAGGAITVLIEKIFSKGKLKAEALKTDAEALKTNAESAQIEKDQLAKSYDMLATTTRTLNEIANGNLLAMSNRLDKLEAELTEREKMINALKTENGKLKTQVCKLTADLKSKDVEISGLTDRITELEGKFTTMENSDGEPNASC